MIEIKDKKECTGCGACINVCPKQAISFKEDGEGFSYPYVDVKKCIDCHLCEKICPLIEDRWKLYVQKEERFPIFYAGQLVNKEELQYVSSGGAFWAFTQTILFLGGVVYGAVQKDVDNVCHLRTTKIEEASQIRRSKYFQSDTKETYSQVKEDLKDGRTVLFSGTGCQIAGLTTFLHKSYPNLYTCDVVCHGVPSRKVWQKYREEKEALVKKKITKLIFRDKSLGWSNNQYKITYEDGSIEKERSVNQLFHAGYLAGLFYRPSCGNCKFANLPRLSDITLADFWKYEGKYHNPETNNMGVSLISVNSSKGEKLLELSKSYLSYEPTTKKQALSSCRHLDEHPTENIYRERFFKMFPNQGYHSSVSYYLEKCNNMPLWKRVRIKIGVLLKNMR